MVAAHRLAAKKSLGQHFLLDEHICARIAAAAGNAHDCTVFEIGPGPGGLTRALLAAGARVVIAVEADARCVAALRELEAAYPDKLTVLHEDALKVSLPALAPAPRKIVANLPYNVGTALLVQWLEGIAAEADTYQSLTLMFQQEVAERIAAPPGGKEYGRLSVFAQWLCDVRPEFILPPGAFSPPPKVHSAVITLTPLARPRFPADKRTLECVLAAGFNQRRKMLRVALRAVSNTPEELLARARIDPTRRAETLSVEEWCALARAHGI